MTDVKGRRMDNKDYIEHVSAVALKARLDMADYDLPTLRRRRVIIRTRLYNEDLPSNFRKLLKLTARAINMELVGRYQNNISTVYKQFDCVNANEKKRRKRYNSGR
jgi:hypothetical protein